MQTYRSLPFVLALMGLPILLTCIAIDERQPDGRVPEPDARLVASIAMLGDGIVSEGGGDNGIPAEQDLPDVQGEIDEVDGFTVLKVWGTPYEMGRAQGYFLAGKMKLLMENFILRQVNPFYWTMARIAYPLVFQEPRRVRQEIKGFVDGALSSGEDIYIDTLHRRIDTLDLKVANALADLSSGKYLCSSFSAFGDATRDSDLAGALAISRNLDWGTGNLDEPFVLSENTIILVRFPEETEYQSTVG